MVDHLALVEGVVGLHVEVAGAGEAEQDGLGLPRLGAAARLLHGLVDGVRALGRGQDGLQARELHGGGEHVGLPYGHGLQVAVVLQLRHDGAHAVVAQAAGVVGAGLEAVAERVHLGERARLARVGEVVGVAPARERGAARGLHGHEARVGMLAAQRVAHERRDEAAQVRPAARAADHDVGILAQLLKSGVALQPDDRLVQHHLVEHTAQRVAPLVLGDVQRALHRLGDGRAERARGIRMLGEHLAADSRGVRRRGRDVSLERLHDVAAERLLLVGALHHEHVQVESEVVGGLGERRAPLARARLGGDARELLGLGVVGLRDGGVQLVGAGRVVALELVEDLRGRAEGALQVVRAA